MHGDLGALNRLMAIEADYYFAAGDTVSWSRGLDAAGAVLARRAPSVHVLPGNHETETAIEGMCNRHGLHAFHGRKLRIAGFHVAGLGYSTPTPFNTPGEYTEDEMAGRLEAFAGLTPLILVCHAPPFGTTLDRMAGDEHAGSYAVREFIERHQPAYFACGHIHEAQGREELIGATRCRNIGKQGFLLDFDTLKV